VTYFRYGLLNLRGKIYLDGSN